MKGQVILWFTIIWVAICCDPVDMSLSVYNDSDQALSVEVFDNARLDYNDFNPVVHYIESSIRPHSTRNLIEMGKDAWKDRLEHSSSGQLYIVVFSTDTLKKYEDISALLVKGSYRVFPVSKSYLDKKKWTVEISP